MGICFQLPTALFGQATYSAEFLDSLEAYCQKGMINTSYRYGMERFEIIADSSKPYLLNSMGKIFFDLAANDPGRPDFDSLISLAMLVYEKGLTFTAAPKTKLSELWANKGGLYGLLNKFDLCIEDCSKAIALDPDNTNAYWNRSIAYYNSGEYENAVKDFEKILKQQPDNASIWYEKGMLERVLQKNKAAIKDLTRALTLKPNFALAYLERARAYNQRGKRKKAKADYVKAVQYGAELSETDKQFLK